MAARPATSKPLASSTRTRRRNIWVSLRCRPWAEARWVRYGISGRVTSLCAESTVVCRERVARLTEPDVDVIVVAGEPRRQALADQNRVVEVDGLDVAHGDRSEALDHLAGGRPVVGSRAPCRARDRALVVGPAEGAHVHVEAAPVRLVARDRAAMLERHIADRHPSEAQRLDRS